MQCTETRRKWIVNNREKISNTSRKYVEKVKLEVFSYYSLNLICECCNESEYEFLTLDHIDGKKKFGHDKTCVGYTLYLWVKRNNFPEGFRILCWNCNSTMGKINNPNRICPHDLHKNGWEWEL